VGWAKRGPSGVIGTNKSDAADVMKALVSKLLETSKGDVDLSEELNGVEIINQQGWEKINAEETSEGEKVGKPRRKITDISTLISSSK
jgi:ferredoxin--NADP+ reductase